MKISRFNHEGYHDLRRIWRFRTSLTRRRKQRRKNSAATGSPLPPHRLHLLALRGRRQGQCPDARRYCRFAVQKDCIPIASHLFFPQFMDDNDAKQRDLGLYMATVLLTKCSEVWVFGRRISSGMAAEIYKAETRGMPIRYFTEEMEEIRHG